MQLIQPSPWMILPFGIPRARIALAPLLFPIWGGERDQDGQSFSSLFLLGQWTPLERAGQHPDLPEFSLRALRAFY